jgi:four helix bundle protein
MTPERLKQRTKQFALRVIRLWASPSHRMSNDVIARQLLRSGTAVGANDRPACRARPIANRQSVRPSQAEDGRIR